MAFPTAVNNQITDAVTQSPSALRDLTEATVVAHTEQVASHALALLMENATAAQQRGQTIADAVVASGVALIYATDETGRDESK